jgi:hypothetical protein
MTTAAFTAASTPAAVPRPAGLGEGDVGAAAGGEGRSGPPVGAADPDPLPCHESGEVGHGSPPPPRANPLRSESTSGSTFEIRFPATFELSSASSLSSSAPLSPVGTGGGGCLSLHCTGQLGMARWCGTHPATSGRSVSATDIRYGRSCSRTERSAHLPLPRCMEKTRKANATVRSVRVPIA